MAGTRPLLPLLLGTALAGCTVGPDYRTPDAAALNLPARLPSQPAEATDQDIAAWWRGFGDPTLTALIERALAASPDIATAAARLEQSRAALREAHGAQLPSIDASASVTRSVGRASNNFVDPTTGQVISSGGDTTIYRGSIGAAWEADIFGGLRRNAQAARATLEQTEANLHFAQLTIAADLGSAYMDARQAQLRLAIARDNLASQTETVEIVGWRVQAGLVSSLDFEQSRQLRAQTEAQLNALEQTYTAAVNRIAVLSGDAPGAVTATLAVTQPIPLPASPPAAGIPADTIARRPDVRAAERGLAAEVARIGVAEAQLYPALRLSGNYTGSGVSLANAWDQAFGNLIAGLTAPIFNGGQLSARVRQQRAAADAAVSSYRATVLTAMEEADNAYAALTAAGRREASLTVADEAARNATLFARAQYRAGLIDFQTLLDSERSLLSSQDGRATARGDRARASVALYRALGGGWQAAPPPPAAGPYLSRTR